MLPKFLLHKVAASVLAGVAALAGSAAEAGAVERLASRAFDPQPDPPHLVRLGVNPAAAVSLNPQPLPPRLWDPASRLGAVGLNPLPLPSRGTGPVLLRPAR